MKKALILGIQKFSIHDGPGIRTTVFFKGCNLRCAWCHNPESISNHPQVIFHSGVPETRGKWRTIDEIMSEVLKDKHYYTTSGGGLTVSGGEPMQQFEATKELLQKAHDAGIHTVLETNGVADFEYYEELLPWIDLFLLDYKMTDNIKCKELTGQTNQKMLASLEKFQEKNTNVILRCPVIPGVNDNKEHFIQIANLTKIFPVIWGYEIMPYHSYGVKKAKMTGWNQETYQIPAADEVDSWNDCIKRYGGRRWIGGTSNE